MKLCRLLRFLLIAAAAHGQQANQLTHSEPDISSLVELQTKQHADSIRLQEQLAELQRKLEVDPHKKLRDEIQKYQDFVVELHAIRVKAEEVVPAHLARTLDFLAQTVERKAFSKKTDLAVIEQAAAAERLALSRQIDAKRQDLADSEEIERTWELQIKDMREERIRSHSLAEIQALENASDAAKVALKPSQWNIKSLGAVKEKQ